MARTLDPRTSPRARFAVELTRHRQESRLTQARLAERLGISASLVSHMEQARRVPQRDIAEKCDRIFGLADKRFFLGLHDRIMRDLGSPLWSVRWLEVEPRATTLRMWDPLLVPGLLQTGDYARAVYLTSGAVSPEQVDERVHTRVNRRAILERRSPPSILVLMDEGILHRPIGGPEVLAEQLRYLVEIAMYPTVTMQIVPVSAGCAAGLESAFVLAELPNYEPDMAYKETTGDGQVTAEPDVVSHLKRRYERIRVDAHP